MCVQKVNFKKAALFSEMAYILNVSFKIYGTAEDMTKGAYNFDLLSFTNPLESLKFSKQYSIIILICYS